MMMNKTLCLLLSALLALLPAAGGASWMDDFSTMEELIALFSGQEEYGSYDSYDGSSAMDDLMALFGAEEPYSGYDDSADGYDDWINSLLGGESDAPATGLAGLESLFGIALDDDYSWFGGSTSDVTSWFNPNIPLPQDTDSDTTWAIYWYLCGSDLESQHGLATDDLNEMLQSALPPNASVVIQTGGASVWQNNVVDENRSQRWLYQDGEFSRIYDAPCANMGEMETLASFLDFCNRNFPADKRAVLFWNHGGGSVGGLAYDEQFDNDSLTLSEVKAALHAVFEPDLDSPPFELIGFDTCLMGTIDVAHILQGFGRYLVASQETEPGCGWDYVALGNAIGQNPGISGAELGRVICDSYAQGCMQQRWHDTITLSVTDLSRVQPLVQAYEAFGAEALNAAANDGSFFSRFARAAARSENYGGNTREQGYTNMVDLGHLARLTTDLLPSAQQVVDALDGCVLYRINGPYRTEATGLSCYYTYSGDMDNLDEYARQGVGEAFAQYYHYGLTGQLTQQGQSLLGQALPTQPAAFATLADTNWDGLPLTVDENGTACLNLGPQAQDVLTGIGFQLFWIDHESDLMLFLGTDNDMEASWEKGLFYDNFRGVWGSLNDQLVYMELSFEGDDYNLYSVPILLNDEECHLQVAYDFVSESWQILGARQGLEQSSGMAAKDVRLLRNGDVIVPVWYAATLSGDDDFAAYAMDPITITDSLTFGEALLPDGSYGMMFEMWDAQGTYAYSQPVYFAMTDGEAYTYLE